MVKIPNFLIVAIDTELRDYLTEKGVNVYYKDIQVRLALYSSMEMTPRRKKPTYYTLCEPRNAISLSTALPIPIFSRDAGIGQSRR